MSNTITRNFISDNFLFTDLFLTEKKKTYDKKELEEKINFWKYVLRCEYGAAEKESILIGLQKLGIDYFAIILAAAELSLRIVVVDYNRTDNFKDVEYSDPKTKLLSPIDIFLHDFKEETLESNQKIYSKFLFFKKHSRKTHSTVNIENINIDMNLYNDTARIMPKENDVLFRVTSSGTTDIPKIIEHTHEFIFKISKRNSKMYKGTAVHVNNLNHGASASVTLLPLLTSDNVDRHLFYDVGETESISDLVDVLTPYKDSIGYLSFPYPFLIDKFIESSRTKKVNWPNLDLITLSYILENAKIAVRDKIFKSITSIFGSNETLGPLFFNRADKENWNIDSSKFLIPDDFYKIDLSDEGKITITVPVYNREIVTNDYFKKDGDFYIHCGRSDMFRINGEKLNLSTINDLNKKYTKTYIVVDTLNHCLYLACWEELDLEEISEIKTNIENNFDRIKITKISQVDKSNFYYGIKIDNELLREYFRTYNV